MSAPQILIVEDEIVVASDIKEELKNLDYDPVDIATTGEEAIQKAGELTPDLILMDIHLNGGMDGIEAAQIIKQDLDVPILYLTAYTNESYLERAQVTEPYAYILKPLRIRELQSNISIALYKHKMERKIKELNQELQKANATKDKFFSIISHDLRGPLLSIISGNELLVNNADSYTIEKIKMISRSMLTSSTVLYKLLEDLLSWSRLQRGKIKYSPNKIDLFFIAHNNEKLFTEPAEEKDITLENMIEIETYVRADCHMVKTILRNLINNAIKFTEPGGKVSIYSHTEDNYEKVVVEDTGIGIEEEDIPKLFQIDTKHQTNGTSGEKGNGLGLVLCKEFIEKNKGEIWVESEVGKGSKFIFTLPKP